MADLGAELIVALIAANLNQIAEEQHPTCHTEPAIEPGGEPRHGAGQLPKPLDDVFGRHLVDDLDLDAIEETDHVVVEAGKANGIRALGAGRLAVEIAVVGEVELEC